MDKAAALKYFAKYLKEPCTHVGCGKPAGQLCDTPALWIHAERIIPFLPERKKS